VPTVHVLGGRELDQLPLVAIEPDAVARHASLPAKPGTGCGRGRRR
jgi:hypothetical protein